MPQPSEPPVVEVASDASHVVLVCHACPDRRRLPRHDLALTVGVAAFVDEHSGCGPVAIRLPEDDRTAVPV